jgi:predicted membrane-bound spermidine synthase
VAFVVGAASLGAEIGAARLLAPFFGDSTFVWANTIATILVGLAAGYWLGGRLADRLPRLSVMCTLIAAAALLLAAVPFVAGPLLRTASSALADVSAGAFIGSLVGVLGLVFVPVCLLGAVAPFTIRLSVAEVAGAGKVSGRIYAVSTMGSLVGTFLAALLLIPLIGTRKTFLVFALSLALVAMVGLPRRLAVVPLAVAALFFVPVGAVKPPGPGERLLYEEETPYQYARVLERPDGERLLELDEGQAVHSVYRPGSFLTGGYWDDSLVLPFATRSTPPRRIAILGDAAGSMARAYGHFFPRTRIDAVEIDGDVTAIGRRFFHLSAPHLKTITTDARVFIRTPGPRYDVIILDAYPAALHPVPAHHPGILRGGPRKTHAGRGRPGQRRPSGRIRRTREGPRGDHGVVTPLRGQRAVRSDQHLVGRRDEATARSPHDGGWPRLSIRSRRGPAAGYARRPRAGRCTPMIVRRSNG